MIGNRWRWRTIRENGDLVGGWEEKGSGVLPGINCGMMTTAAVSNVTLLASSPACYALLLKNNDDILLTTTRWMEGCGAEETLVAGQQKLRAAITAVMALTKGKQLHPWINAGCLNNDLDNCTLSGGDDNNDAHQTIDTDFRARSLLNYRDRQKFPPLPPYLKTLPVIDRNFEVPVPATADE